MRRKRSAALPLGMQMPPPTAQQAIVDLGKLVMLDQDEGHRVETLLRDDLDYGGDALNYTEVTVVADHRNIVGAVLATTEYGIWLFDYPQCRRITGAIWNRWVRFDVLRVPNCNFVTVGFSLYDGEMPITERLKREELLGEAELTGGHLYALKIEPFLQFATDSIERFGVPATAHRVPKMV
jgi:hypothetical protein